MDREVLKDSLDGFFAYDSGCGDSGIHHPELRDLCRTEMQSQPELAEQFAAELYREPDYHDEDRQEFIEWTRLDL